MANLDMIREVNLNLLCGAKPNDPTVFVCTDFSKLATALQEEMSRFGISTNVEWRDGVCFVLVGEWCAQMSGSVVWVRKLSEATLSFTNPHFLLQDLKKNGLADLAKCLIARSTQAA